MYVPSFMRSAPASLRLSLPSRPTMLVLLAGGYLSAPGNAFAQSDAAGAARATDGVEAAPAAGVEPSHEDVIDGLRRAQGRAASTKVRDARESERDDSSDAVPATPRARLHDLADPGTLFSGMSRADFGTPGSLPDAADYAATPDGAPARDGMPALGAVRRVSLRRHDTRVKNQSERGWCTSFATIAAMENLVSRRYGEEVNLSEIHLWSHYQQYDMFASVAAAERQPIAPESEWAYRESRPSGIDGKGIARVTSSRELTDRSDVLDALDRGNPVVMGTLVNSSWDYADDGYLSTGGREMGGHAIAVVGYAMDSRSPGGGYFVIKNSWGRNWGDNGYGYVPFAQCQTSWCAFIEIRGVNARGL